MLITRDCTELKKLAKKKFSKSDQGFFLGGSSSLDRPIVDAILSTTPSTDRGLRDILASACSKLARDLDIMKLDEDPDLTGMMEDHGMLGLMVLRPILRHRALLRDKALAAQKKLKRISELVAAFPPDRFVFHSVRVQDTDVQALREEITGAEAALQESD